MRTTGSKVDILLRLVRVLIDGRSMLSSYGLSLYFDRRGNLACGLGGGSLDLPFAVLGFIV